MHTQLAVLIVGGYAAEQFASDFFVSLDEIGLEAIHLQLQLGELDVLLAQRLGTIVCLVGEFTHCGGVRLLAHAGLLDEKSDLGCTLGMQMLLFLQGIAYTAQFELDFFFLLQLSGQFLLRG